MYGMSELLDSFCVFQSVNGTRIIITSGTDARRHIVCHLQ